MQKRNNFGASGRAREDPGLKTDPGFKTGPKQWFEGYRAQKKPREARKDNLNASGLAREGPGLKTRPGLQK